MWKLTGKIEDRFPYDEFFNETTFNEFKAYLDESVDSKLMNSYAKLNKSLNDKWDKYSDTLTNWSINRELTGLIKRATNTACKKAFNDCKTGSRGWHKEIVAQNKTTPKFNKLDVIDNELQISISINTDNDDYVLFFQDKVAKYLNDDNTVNSRFKFITEDYPGIIIEYKK